MQAKKVEVTRTWRKSTSMLTVIPSRHLRTVRNNACKVCHKHVGAHFHFRRDGEHHPLWINLMILLRIIRRLTMVFFETFSSLDPVLGYSKKPTWCHRLCIHFTRRYALSRGDHDTVVFGAGRHQCHRSTNGEQENDSLKYLHVSTSEIHCEAS